MLRVPTNILEGVWFIIAGLAILYIPSVAGDVSFISFTGVAWDGK